MIAQGLDTHEKVVRINDDETGLRAIIAIHSTALGPAGGGCRLWTYPGEAEATADALRLSRGMSFKNALAGLALGGGKSVIMGPVDPACRSVLFEAFGRAVDDLQGQYVTAEDVGVSVADMQVVATKTPYVSGLAASDGSAGGDPSPYTAMGVRLGMEAAVLVAMGRTSLDGVRVAIQGLGGVGGNLARELSERGARLVVADIDPDRVDAACDRFRAEKAEVEEILLSDVDVVAPCALGGAITQTVAQRLRASVVAGGANNQLANPSTGALLQKRGITYAPDYLINAGGIIMVAAEYSGGRSIQAVHDDVGQIYARTRALLEKAKQQQRPAGNIADETAEAIIRAAARSRADRG